MYESYSISLHK
uniref:Uncharacterized protein n=1 Tax=Arundo donax TaxID=35708 RepID=A0A0A9BWY0_ARUDO